MADLKIGPTFPDEIKAAGIDLDGFGWSTTDGTLMFNEDVPQAKRDKIAAVLAKHDPTKQTDPPTIVPVIPTPKEPPAPQPIKE